MQATSVAGLAVTGTTIVLPIVVLIILIAVGVTFVLVARRRSRKERP
jgi:hypothetical protein